MDSAVVDAAKRLGAELLRPQAEHVDVHGVPRSHLDTLAATGLMDLSSLPTTVQRAVAEELAAADASTWFVWTQHHTPVRTVARSDNALMTDHWLPRLRRGETLAGVAFTHLRRPGPPAVRATRDGASGWVLDGDIAWLTSWGIADVFLVGAQHEDDVVWLLLPLTELAGVEQRPLTLAAMQGTSTVGVSLHGVRCGDDDVVLVEPLAQWRAVDAGRVIDVSPAVFGVSAECARRLRERDADLAAAIDGRAEELRAEAYRLADTADAGDVQRRLEVRAAAHLLALDASAALVASGAGRAMLLDHAAQRLARTALFLFVQGQTPDVRQAQLDAVSDRLRASHAT
jgi:alkylation response protein AidB-like acyl-CoA dehydrogenase